MRRHRTTGSAVLAALLFFSAGIFAEPLIQNPQAREQVSLNGLWHYLVDPYETGYRNHRNWLPFDEAENTKASASPYWLNRKMQGPSDRIEYDFGASPTLEVPGDWNHQDDTLLYYEGTLWYERDFDFAPEKGQRYFLHFGAVNYRADVYLNGEKVGFHEGPYDPFNFEVTGRLQEGLNEIVVRADNRRSADRVPGRTTDWWNYGGITRDVAILSLPEAFVRDYHLQLDPDDASKVAGYVQVDGAGEGQGVRVSIPEAGLEVEAKTGPDGRAAIELPANELLRWYPERPKLYDVVIRGAGDEVRDRIGFRTIERDGEDILLNGKRIFLRGISLHEENPVRVGRAHSREDAALLFGWAKELNCNMVRLAHYPHHENMPRLADEIGLLLWEEVPVYWGINYINPDTFTQAEDQLKSLITRDKNRASVIVWSVANETPRDDPQRLDFLSRMAETVRGMDRGRFVSAALDRTEDKENNLVTVTDPFAAP